MAGRTPVLLFVVLLTVCWSACAVPQQPKEPEEPQKTTHQLSRELELLRTQVNAELAETRRNLITLVAGVFLANLLLSLILFLSLRKRNAQGGAASGGSKKKSTTSKEKRTTTRRKRAPRTTATTEDTEKS